MGDKNENTSKVLMQASRNRTGRIDKRKQMFTNNDKKNKTDNQLK